jgi:hypothetical protein
MMAEAEITTPGAGAGAIAPTVTVRNNILDKDGKIKKEEDKEEAIENDRK